MLFRYSLTVPAKTTEVLPFWEWAPVTKGLLHHVSISFPPGCVALTHVAVLYHEDQIIPINRSEYLAWDNATFEWDEDIQLDTAPYKLKLVGWNEDQVYPHTIVFRFGIKGAGQMEDVGLMQQFLGMLRM